MNQKSIFLFILLISLSATNAIPLEKRATQFQDCRGGNFRNAEFIDVSMSPDPLVSNQNVIFDVSGTLKNNDIKDNNSFVRVQLDDADGTPIDRIRTNVTTAIRAGQTFDIKTQQHTLPDIPDKYQLTVIIVNPSDPPNPATDVIGCATTR
ncbi:20379_t:CDS:1, partial [Gigaspora rosea]